MSVAYRWTSTAAAIAAPIAPAPQPRVDDHGARSGDGHCLLHQELRPLPWHEDPRFDGDPQAAELRPADDVLERTTGDPPVHHAGKLPRRTSR